MTIQINYRNILKLAAFGLILFAFSCERDFDGLEPASFPTDADVFIDAFSGGLSYAAFGNSDVRAFQVDEDVVYEGSASMRFAVPPVNDPKGAFAGGAFTTSIGRDLSGYDALTFWAKATQTANLDVLGFGNDLGESKYVATINNVPVNTNWQKYYIPLPNPELLTEERGMFFYSEGAENGNGYTFWIDELKFEKLGTLADPTPLISGGQDAVISSETGGTVPIGNLEMSFNLPNGVDQVMNIAPAYFNFLTSNPSIASVDATGTISVLDSGQAVITGMVGDIDADGSLTINSTGDAIKPLTSAPTPTQSPDSVISMFSNAYEDVVVDTWNPFWEFSTTQNEDIVIGDGDDVKRYTMLNFVGILTESEKIDASEMTHFHLDIWTPDPTDAPKAFKVLLVDFGADGNFGVGDDSSHELSFTAPTLQTESWVSLDIPLRDFTGLVNRNNIAQLVLSGDLPNLFVDNVYYYKGELDEIAGPETAANAPTAAAEDVISLFSNAYDDVTIDTWSAVWDDANVEDIQVNGDDVKLYTGLSFAGVEFTSEPIDVTEMERFHMDIWTPDPTAMPATFKIKLVDFGPDGAFDGGDDTEHEIALNMENYPALATGNWVGIDVPMSDFVGLTTRGSLAQMIISGDPNTLYVDNVYLYKGDGGGNNNPTEPEVGAPMPSANAANVISLFSDQYDDVPVDTWRTDWSAADFEDVEIAGNPTKKYANLDFVGIETVSSTIDAGAMTHVHLDVWSADYTFFGIKLVDFGDDGAIGGGDDVAHQINYEAPVQGEWVSLDIPLPDFAGLTTRSHLAQYILVGQPTGANTLYVDNFFFYKEGGEAPLEPQVAAPTPTREVNKVVSLFSEAYDDVPVDTWRTDWSAATFEDVTIAGNATKKYADLDFVGIETVSNPVDASQMTHIHLDVWSADFTFFGIKLVDFGADGAFGGGDDVEYQINFDMPAQGAWQGLDIPLADFTGLTTTGNIGQIIIVGQPTGATTVFMDNIYFYDDGMDVVTEPEVAAPAPTQNAADVISLFSDVFDDVPVDTWRTDWSSADFEDVSIAGDATKKYSNLDFVGIETVANPVDASQMTHVHLDVWSPDFTFFGIKLVDFGADGAFGGGDDVEHQINFDMPMPGGWMSIDLPLSDFTGLTTRGSIAQYILAAQPTGAATIFVDNFFFYNDGSNVSNEPDMAAPMPTRPAADVISMFSDAYDDVNVDTWRTDWSSTDFEDVMVEGDPTKKYSNLDFVGIETVSSPVDASQMTHVHLDVWSADYTFFGFKIVDFGADGSFGGGDDVEHQVNMEMPMQGGWMSVDIPLTDFIGLTTRSNLAQYILAAQPTGATTVFIDNFYFFSDGSGVMDAPDMAAPVPTQEAANVISVFSDVYDDVPVDTWRTDWSAADFEDVMVVGNATKKYSNLDFVGIETVSNPVDASQMTHIHLDVWAPDFTLFGVKLVDFGADGAFGGGDDVEHQINFDMPMPGGWMTIDLPLSDFTGLTTRGSIAQYILVAQPTGTATVYIDNIFFYREGTGVATEPSQAAPTPALDAGDVISLFSDTYDNAVVDTWRTPWSAADFEDVQVAGNATKKYSNLDFVGIETVAQTIDASQMTHFHVDVWSPDYTFFGIKLVDFGEDGSFGGGDDVEHQINYEMPVQAGWQSLDIPLSDFVGLTKTAHIAQYILVGQPTGASTLFVDNMYFHK